MTPGWQAGGRLGAGWGQVIKALIIITITIVTGTTITIITITIIFIITIICIITITIIISIRLDASSVAFLFAE